MSRNFQLMEELAGKWPVTSAATVADTPVHQKTSAESEVLDLVQRVFLLRRQNRPKVVVFAGIDQSDECEALCRSVADVLARSTQGRICVVEANFRTPAASAYGSNEGSGFADALVSENPLHTYVKPANSMESWSSIPAGRITAESVNLLGSEKMKTLLGELRTDFDFVLVLGPQLNPFSDSIILGQIADGLVLILEAGSTRRETAQVATLSLRTANIPILAAVLKNRTYPIPEPIYSRL